MTGAISWPSYARNEKTPLGTMTFYVEGLPLPRLEVLIEESVKALKPEEDITAFIFFPLPFGAPAF